MAKTKYTLTDEDFDRIIKINKEGSDPVMFISGETPMGRSLHEKINDFWDELAKEKGFDKSTIQPIDNINFEE